MQGAHSGFIMRFEDSEMKNRRCRQQKMWISSLSRWINIWIVFPRCERPGLKTHHISPIGGYSHRGSRDPLEGGIKTQLSSTHCEASLQGTKAGGLAVSSMSYNLLQARELPPVPHPHKAPSGMNIRQQSPGAWKR